MIKSDESFNPQQSFNHKVLNECNPNYNLYCICMISKDFISLKNNTRKKKTKVWNTKKIYCFVTYFPFIKFFLDLSTFLLSKKFIYNFV